MDKATRERIKAQAAGNKANGVILPPCPQVIEKPAPAAAPTDTPAKPKKEKSTVSKDGIPKITFLCGHTGCLPLCGPCRDKLNRERNERRREKQIAKQAARAEAALHEEFNPKSRLPDGSTKLLAWDATAQLWTGSLNIPNVGTFTAQEVSEKRCYHALDDRYREHIGQQPAPANSEKLS